MEVRERSHDGDYLEEISSGWVARYLIVSEKSRASEAPSERCSQAMADAVAWLTAEATAHGFVYEPPV